MNHLLYIAHTSAPVRRQALWAALSALAFKGALPLRVHLWTDAPREFGRLEGEVELREVGAETVRGWIAPTGYQHRAKPAALRELARAFPGDKLALADADTFFKAPLAPLYERIGPGAAVMHQREYQVSERDSPMMHRFRRKLARARFRGAPVELDRTMWNSGVVGLGPDLFPLIDDWLAFLDEVWPQTRRWVLEQYALATLLQRAGHEIRPADDLLVHYWWDKPRHDQAIAEALARTEGRGLAAVLEELRAHPIEIARPPPRQHRPNFFQRVFGW